MSPPAPIDRSTPLPPAPARKSSSKPFSAIKKLRVGPRVVTRFVVGSLLALKSPRGTPDLATALQRSCVAWKNNVLQIEDLRTHLLRQSLTLPSPATGEASTSTSASLSESQGSLPNALLVYDEASASARAEYVQFLQASRDFAQSYVDAVLERMRYQNGAVEVLLALLEMARRLRGEAVQLRVSFKRGPCKQFKCIIKEVSSKPLPLDGDVFKGIDLSLRDILAAYQLLDDFWVTEVQNLRQEIQTVHVDRVRVERWLGYKDTLKESISKWKGIGALTNDRIENVKEDGEPETPAALDLTSIAKQLRPQMMMAGSLLHTMRDHVPSADMAPIQVAIFGLQQSQQQCLSFFTECVKYWEKVDMRRNVSTARPTLEKLVTSQKVLMENLGQGPDKAQLTINALRNAIAHDGWPDKVRERTGSLSRHPATVTGIGSRFAPDHRGIGDVISGLRTLEEPGYDPFRGMSMEELGKERQKWTTCRKLFADELTRIELWASQPRLDEIT